MAEVSEGTRPTSACALIEATLENPTSDQWKYELTEREKRVTLKANLLDNQLYNGFCRRNEGWLGGACRSGRLIEETCPQ